MKLTDAERAALIQAARELDAAWDFDAARGKHDTRPGMEYERVSLAPILRQVAARS